MSTFKFACPSCAQHISCETDQAGSHMECPTCFANIVVPQAPEDGGSKFVLTAAKVSTRVIPDNPDVVPLVREKKGFPFAAVGFVVLLCAAIATGVIFRDKLFKRTPKVVEEAETEQVKDPAPVPLAVKPRTLPGAEPDASWTMNVTNVTIPEGMAMGRISGYEFTNQRTMINGGTLALRLGSEWPPELGLSVRFFVKKGEELAGKTFVFAPDQKKGPDVVLRWWDSQRQPQSLKLTNGYAMRLEFGQPVDRELPGKIYLCTSDEYKSWVVGTFTARIRGPRPGDRPGDP